jgi:hypothetical protein
MEIKQADGKGKPMLQRNAMLHKKISFNIGCCIKVYTLISKKITYKDENEEK